MASENFFKLIKKALLCSIQESFRLIADNNESHLSTEVIEFAKENEVMTPHTSQKLQLLYRPVYGRYKVL